MGVIDAGTLYKVGKAASGPGELRRSQIDPMTRQLFSFVGGQALKYFNSAWDRKKELSDKTELNDAEWASTIAEEGGPLKGLYKDSISKWQEERNRGQDLISTWHGLRNSKKYKEGRALIDNAEMKLQNLHADATERLRLKNEYKGVIKTGMLAGEDGKPIKAKWSSKTTGPRMDNTMALANGDMDKSFEVDPATGRLVLVKELRKGGFGPAGFVDETEIVQTPFNEIQFNKYEDTSSHDVEGTFADNGTKLGNTGTEWNNVIELGIRADAAKAVEEMSPEAFDSYFLGGTHYKYSDAGKSFMTPAQSFIEKKFGYKPGTLEYEGALNTIKEQDLSSPEYKQFAIDSFIDVQKQFHANSLAAWKKKNYKAPKVQETKQWEQQRLDNINRVRRIYKGKGVEYTDDNKTKLVQLGNGYSEVWRWVNKTITEDGVEKEIKKWQKDKNKIRTTEAVSMLGLGGLGVAPPEGYGQPGSQTGPSYFYATEGGNPNIPVMGTGFEKNPEVESLINQYLDNK